MSFKSLFIATSILVASNQLNAQELPKASPLGKVEQIVGVTTISIEYSRPSVKGRTIFGDVVPYGKLWRLGANSATTFTTNTPIQFGEKTLPKGNYALFATPNQNGIWNIVFNSDSKQSGTSNYDASKNVLSLDAKANSNSFNETLVLEINNISNTSAILVIKWDMLRVDIPFTVNTNEMAKANIQEAIQKGQDLDAVYNKSANFYFTSLEDQVTALDYVNRSIAIKESHTNLFLKAQILKKQGNTKEALPLAEKALVLANAANAKGYAEFISGSITEWKK